MSTDSSTSTRTVDAVLQSVDSGWVASVFQDPTLAAAAPDEAMADFADDVVFERLAALGLVD